MNSPPSDVLQRGVLITGASGYIGLAVAAAFRRAGYIVYGLIRDSSKSHLLHAHEIIPVIGDATKIDGYSKYIAASTVIIDCVNTMHEKDHPDVFPLNLLKAVEEASKNRDRLQPPKIFVYTSGIMVYGSADHIQDEVSTVSTKFYGAWRRKVEESVISSPHVSGTVLRPAWVFGGSGGPTADDMFNNPHKVVLYGIRHDRRYSWIHIDDLAEAYVAVVKHSVAARGQIFNIANGYDNPVYADLISKGTKLAGHKDDVHWETNRSWQDEAIDDNVIVNSLHATTLLGWTPKIFGLYENLEFYYQVHKAKKALHLVQ